MALKLKCKSWKRIADYFDDRNDVQCLHRWQKVVDPGLVKGPWTKEACHVSRGDLCSDCMQEDDKVMALVEKYGPKRWSIIAQHVPGRIGKQCRERCVDHDPRDFH